MHQAMLDGQVDCRLETVKRLMADKDALLAALERIVHMPGQPKLCVTNPDPAALWAGHELVRRLKP
jgi:hypothetical protein